MRTALCTLDGVTYRAADFRQVNGFDDKRRYLVCTECGMRAYYRNYARNAREAHFGARPHAEGCTLAAPDQDGMATGQGIEDEPVLTTGQRIILDLNYGTAESSQGQQPARTQRAMGNAGTGGVGEVAVNETTTRRLGPMLGALMLSEQARRPALPITIPGIGDFTIADFFVNFGDVVQDHVGRYQGFWGMVVDVRRDASGTMWLNSGGREDMSICIDSRFTEETFDRFHIEEDEDIAGAYILVLGELRVGPTGKKYVPITEPSRFALRLAR